VLKDPCSCSGLQVEAIVVSPNAESYSQVGNLESLGVKFVNRNPMDGPVNQNCHLVVGADVLSSSSYTQLISNMVDSLKPGGFILLKEGAVVGDDVIKKSGLELAARQLADGKSYLLLRKVRSWCHNLDKPSH
jgi:hypothetical protein